MVLGVHDRSIIGECVGDVVVAASVLGLSVDDLDYPDWILGRVPSPVEDPTFAAVEESLHHHPPFPVYVSAHMPTCTRGIVLAMTWTLDGPIPRNGRTPEGALPFHSPGRCA